MKRSMRCTIAFSLTISANDMENEKYKPMICKCCGQTTTYALLLDRGVVDILKAMARAIELKGINKIHPRNEMEIGKDVSLDYRMMVQQGMLTSNQVGNLSRSRFHGLIARVDNESGVYCLTRKGLDFLRGMEIPLIAIISKAEKRLMGYWYESENTCTIDDFKNDPEYWSGLNYYIEAGQVCPIDAQGTGQSKLSL